MNQYTEKIDQYIRVLSDKGYESAENRAGNIDLWLYYIYTHTDQFDYYTDVLTQYNLSGFEFKICYNNIGDRQSLLKLIRMCDWSGECPSEFFDISIKNFGTNYREFINEMRLRNLVIDRTIITVAMSLSPETFWFVAEQVRYDEPSILNILWLACNYQMTGISQDTIYTNFRFALEQGLSEDIQRHLSKHNFSYFYLQPQSYDILAEFGILTQENFVEVLLKLDFSHQTKILDFLDKYAFELPPICDQIQKKLRNNRVLFMIYLYRYNTHELVEIINADPKLFENFINCKDDDLIHRFISEGLDIKHRLHELVIESLEYANDRDGVYDFLQTIGAEIKIDLF